MNMPVDTDRASGSSTVDRVPSVERPSVVRTLSGGVGLLAHPRSQATDETAPVDSSLLFSVLLDAPSPAPHIARSSPPPPSEPQPVLPPLATTSPRTPPNLRLDIPPPGPAQEAVRAPFAPDSENEGICTEVGSLGQEIQLESGDHLNALERIYLYTQSKATFHRIFMSRALPTYLKEVTPTEAVEYVLPLLGGLAIDEEEQVKEAFVAELLVIIWWFFTTCKVTDQEPDPPEAESTDPPLIPVQTFSAVLASLLLSSNPDVSATARGTVVELLGRTRWIVKGEGLQDEVQHVQYCETMRPVEAWSRGLLGPEEARMIQLEIIYMVVIDLGRLDLNGVEGEYGVEGEVQAGEVPYGLQVDPSQEDLSTLAGTGSSQNDPLAGTSSSQNDPEPRSLDQPNSILDQPNSTLALPPLLNSSILADPALTPTAETIKTYGTSVYSPPLDGSSRFVSSQNLDSVSSFGLSNSASSSSTSLDLPSNDEFASMPRSAPPTTTAFSPPSAASVPVARSMSQPASESQPVPGPANGAGADTSSTSSLGLPELSPADSSSRSSVASPAEPISPPEDAGAEYITTREDYMSMSVTGSGEDYMSARPSGGGRAHTNKSDDSEKTVEQDTVSGFSSDAGDELVWYTPRGGEGFETGYFDAPSAGVGGSSAGAGGSSANANANASGSSTTTNGSSPNSSNPVIVTSTSHSSPPSAGGSPTTSFKGGLAPYTRPMLGRQDSMLSMGSEVNPDDFADAESGGEWNESEGVGEQPAPEAEAAATENEVVVDDGTPTEAPLEPDAIGLEGDAAYIDDGAAAEEAAIGRVASMSLIAAVTSSGVVDDEIYMLFVDEVLRVSADPVYWVRSETSYALGTLAKVLPEETVGSYLLPILEALMTDTEGHVRQSSVFAIPPVLKRLSPQRRRDLASQYVLRLCEDTAETVRTGALQVLAEVIHTFCEDEGGPPAELVDFFLKGEKNQARASLPKPPAEEKTPVVEKDRYSEWAPQPSTWGEPSSYFEVEPSFPEPDRALICAFNYPAIAHTLGPERWSRLADYYKYLAEESWHTPKVRSTLAASSGEIARIIGPRAARTDVLPVWWICLSSDQREAKIKALKALPMLLEVLDTEGRADVAAKLGEAWENHLSGWKEREALARQLKTIAPLLRGSGLVLCRIFKGGLEDRVAAIREAVIDALPVLHEVLKDDDTHTKMTRDDLFTLGASGMGRHKTTFLACCRTLVESSQGASVLDDPRFGPIIVPLAEHSVIDVRIALGRLLTAICEHHMQAHDQRPKWLVNCLERLSLDTSSDVRSFVHRAATAEYIEPRTVASKLKPDNQPSSPIYAEFSRPP